jgi:hypothetical protein
LRRAQSVAVGERRSKSKFIPSQARALANVLKQAVVQPLKRTITKRKSFETNVHDQPIDRSSSSIDQRVCELSIDSNESTSLVLLTPPPAKPPRQINESDSSSSSAIDLRTCPPAKPPRLFSLLNKVDDARDVIEPTDTIVTNTFNLVDTFASPLLSTIESIDHPTSSKRLPSISDTTSVQITVDSLLNKSTNMPTTFDAFERVIPTLRSCEYCSDDFIPTEMIQLANTQGKTILNDSHETHNVLSTTMNNHDSTMSIDQANMQNIVREHRSALSQSRVTMHVSPARTTTTRRPLMFVSLDSTVKSRKAISSAVDIATTTSTPLISTSVRVTGPLPMLVSSNATVTHTNGEHHTCSTVTSRHDSSISLATSNKQSSQTSINTLTYDSGVFFPTNLQSCMSTHALQSNYDDRRHSYDNLTDRHTIVSSIRSLAPCQTHSSSISTVYETFDNEPSSTTSPTYLSALSTFNTNDTSISVRCYSDRTDDDPLDSFDVDSSSKGRHQY